MASVFHFHLSFILVDHQHQCSGVCVSAMCTDHQIAAGVEKGNNFFRFFFLYTQKSKFSLNQIHFSNLFIFLNSLEKQTGIMIFRFFQWHFSKLIISYVSKYISLWIACWKHRWNLGFGFLKISLHTRELPVPCKRLEKWNYPKQNRIAKSIPWIYSIALLNYFSCGLFYYTPWVFI